MTEITLEQVHAMVSEHMEHETARVKDRITSVQDVVRTGGFSRVTAKNRIELQMEAIINTLVDDPSTSNIETLSHLQAMRAVAERIEKGVEVMGPLPTEEEKPKAAKRRKTKAKPAALVDDAPNPPEVLESNQEFLASTPEPETQVLVGASGAEDPVPELDKADNSVLDLL